MPGSTAASGEHQHHPAPAPYEARVHRQLLQWGLSPQGLQHLVQGQMPSAAQDRRLVAGIVAQAARD